MASARVERAAAADARGSTVRTSHTIPSVRILIPWRDGVDALASAQHEPALKKPFRHRDSNPGRSGEGRVS